MSDPIASQPVLDRLARLERENRRFKLAAGVSTLLLFGWTACSVAPQAAGTLTAERFVLLGADGKETGALGLDDKGNPCLILNQGKATAALTTYGPAVLLRAPDGKTSAYMGVDSRNISKLELTSERVLDGVRLSTRPDGSCGLYVLDTSGRERGGLESLSVGGVSLLMRDDAGRVRTQMGVDAQNMPSAILLDNGGGRRIGMVIDQDGSPMLEMQDDRARPRFQLSTAFDGTPRLELLREDGGEAFRAP